MYYRFCKMDVPKTKLPSFCDLTKDNQNAFLSLMQAYMGDPDYDIVIEIDDEQREEFNAGLDKFQEILKGFCLACAKKQHDPENLVALWCEWGDDKDDGLSIIESYVDMGDGTIFYDFDDWDIDASPWLIGEPMEIYDSEQDETVLLRIESEDDYHCLYGQFHRIFSYSGKPNEAITDAFMEQRRAEENKRWYGED